MMFFALRSAPGVFSRSSFAARSNFRLSAVRTFPGVSAEGDTVEVVFDGKKHKFLSFWLRDHCRCPECCHPETSQRLVDTVSVSPHIVVDETEVKAETNRLVVHFSDKHSGYFDIDFLREVVNKQPREIFPPKLWTGRSIRRDLPEITLEEINSGNEGMLSWLKLLKTRGFSLVKGVEPNMEGTKALLSKIGLARSTLYGDWWEFTSDMAHKDTAYTTLALRPHTDGTYFHEPPCLQVFHLTHFEGTGGLTGLVDGWNAAEQLKSEDPEAHALLSSLNVSGHYIEPGHHYVSRGRIIQNDDAGNIQCFRWNNDDRDVMYLSVDEMRKFYRAHRLLGTIINSEENALWLQLEPGTVLVVHNWRVMHGRSAFTGTRRMVGCYLGVDEFENRLRVVQEELARKGRKPFVGLGRDEGTRAV